MDTTKLISLLEQQRKFKIELEAWLNADSELQMMIFTEVARLTDLAKEEKKKKKAKAKPTTK